MPCNCGKTREQRQAARDAEAAANRAQAARLKAEKESRLTARRQAERSAGIGRRP